jgi:UTP:GlnB (protein PII) uridylyltransferase
VAVLVDRVVEASEGELGREEVASHLTGLSDIYRTSHSPGVIRDHILLARQPLGPGGGLVSTLLGTPTRIMLVARDRPRLLLEVAGILALNNMSIIDARFATRTDGRVFDTFEVVDAGGREITGERAGRVEAELVRTLRGGFDVERELAAKQRAYRDTRRHGFEPHVTVVRQDGGGGRIEIECADRVGLLRELAEVFATFGMPITRARVDTRGGVAYDSFLVSRVPADSRPLEEALLGVMG